jgi:hypothetical protein
LSDFPTDSIIKTRTLSPDIRARAHLSNPEIQKMNADIETLEGNMIRISYGPKLLIAILLVTDGSTTHYNTDSQKKTKDGKTDYSRNTTATTTDNTDTYEVYTIQAAEKTYIAREKLLFPWSKPANVTVGAELKYAIEGRRLIILDEDQKEHKASIVKTTLNEAN